MIPFTQTSLRTRATTYKHFEDKTKIEHRIEHFLACSGFRIKMVHGWNTDWTQNKYILFLFIVSPETSTLGQVPSSTKPSWVISAQWPGLWMAARLHVTLFWYRLNSLLCTYVVLMLKSWHLNRPSPPASLAFVGQVTEQTTGKWAIAGGRWKLPKRSLHWIWSTDKHINWSNWFMNVIFIFFTRSNKFFACGLGGFLPSFNVKLNELEKKENS